MTNGILKRQKTAKFYCFFLLIGFNPLAFRRRLIARKCLSVNSLTILDKTPRNIKNIKF